MRVWLAHPKWRLSCASCEAYLYTADGVLHRDGATGEPLLRLGDPTPCPSCPKVPAWAKASGRPWAELRATADDLSPANRAALSAYQRFKATGRFPDDAVVSWYSGLFRAAEDEWAAVQADRTHDAVTALFSVLTVRHRP